MGFEANENSPDELWRRYAYQFPVRDHAVYLNHAAVAPLCRPAAQAMQALAQDVLEYGCLHEKTWIETYEKLRVAAAALLGANRDEIAIVKNTSAGICAIANGIDWRSGDKIVAFREEFPSNFFPWQKLERRGVRVEWLSCFDPLDRIEQACRGARLLAISFVQYLSGYRAPLEAIGEICNRNNVIFMVDAIQGIGAFPVDVKRARIHALAADGHKWLLAPEGCAILFIAKEIQDTVQPLEWGWMNTAGYGNYGARQARLPTDAGRYEGGTLNTIGCYGLLASIHFLLNVGLGVISPVVQKLSDAVAEGVQAQGYEVLGGRPPGHGAGIVSFKRSGINSAELVQKLGSAGVVAAHRQGWVRVSPHFYISPGEISQMLAVLP